MNASPSSNRVLAIDDGAKHRGVLADLLPTLDVVCAQDVEDALRLVHEAARSGDRFGVVLLNEDELDLADEELLGRLQALLEQQHLPVIQGCVRSERPREGSSPRASAGQGTFRFRTLDEASALAPLLAQTCPDPQRVTLGLAELLVNAVEHGNLGITCTQTATLRREERWLDEIERRLRLPEYRQRYAEVTVRCLPDKIEFTIRDQGIGFDPVQFEASVSEPSLEPNGRGIALARSISFDQVVFEGNGNCAVCTVRR